MKRVLLRIPEGMDLELLEKLGYEVVRKTRKLIVEGYPAELGFLIKEAKEAIRKANLRGLFGPEVPP